MPDNTTAMSAPCEGHRLTQTHYANRSGIFAGREMKDMVEAAVKRCDGDMRALQGEHVKSDRALKLQLHAVLEQARDMRVWREQHNIRLLEMQACLCIVPHHQMPVFMCSTRRTVTSLLHWLHWCLPSESHVCKDVSHLHFMAAMPILACIRMPTAC